MQTMLTLETALFAGVGFAAANARGIAVLMCIFAIIMSFSWRHAVKSQRQFIELRRRILREIEAQIEDGVNFFTIDQRIFWRREPYQFSHTGERIPDDKVFKKVLAGATKREADYAAGFAIFWIFVLFALIVWLLLTPPDELKKLWTTASWAFLWLRRTLGT